jgi:hypothetical protein
MYEIGNGICANINVGINIGIQGYDTIQVRCFIPKHVPKIDFFSLRLPKEASEAEKG